MITIQEVIERLGYVNLRRETNGWRTKPLYRASDNPTSLKIFDNGSFKDFSSGDAGNLNKLIGLTLNASPAQVREWRKTHGISNFSEDIDKTHQTKAKITTTRVYQPEILNKLLPHETYWLNRGIRKDTLRTFKGGLATGGKMLRRYVFPIFDAHLQIIGFAGRYVMNPLPEGVPPWKLIGHKTSWVYPLFLSKSFIEEKKEVVLVESVGDMLALWQADVKNVLVMFGANERHHGISSEMIKHLVSLSPKRILISTNNDETNGLVGNHCAEHMRKKLANYFDENQLQIALPQSPFNDFGEMSEDQIKIWKNLHNY